MSDCHIDLSLIDDDELEALAGWFGRLVVEFSDKPALAVFIDELYRLLDSERFLRLAGIRTGEAEGIDLAGHCLALDRGELKFLENFFGQMVYTARSRRFLGSALLDSLTNFLESGDRS